MLSAMAMWVLRRLVAALLATGTLRRDDLQAARQLFRRTLGRRRRGADAVAG